jgi:hypothetical protein
VQKSRFAQACHLFQRDEGICGWSSGGQDEWACWADICSHQLSGWPETIRREEFIDVTELF